MPELRPILGSERIHPSIAKKIGGKHGDFVEEVEAAIRSHKVVVVGLGWSPPSANACRFLRSVNIPFHYIEHGNYLTGWRRRNALKMWTGWPTFPMVFVNGTFIGGATDLKKLHESGGLTALLA